MQSWSQTVLCHGPNKSYLLLMLLPLTTKLVHAFISSRVDYCNSLLVGVTGQLLHRLQVIQNAAARLVTEATRYEHMTPVLRSLHWLPVWHRITFKIAVTVYKCLRSLAPPYLTEYCTSTSFDAGRRHLRSAYTLQLIIPRTRTSYGDRSFAIHGPVVWNFCATRLISGHIQKSTENIPV